MATTTPILGQYEANLAAATNGTADRVATDKDTFLKLLVAQLTHQDPLNPVEDKEFIAQLAQFTSVEELQNINKGIEGLNDAYGKQQLTNASSLLGGYVSAKGDMINVSGGAATPVTALFPADAADATINVSVMNPDGTVGKLVWSNAVGAVNSGPQQFNWSAKDASGAPVPDGNYLVSVSAVDANGNNMLVETSAAGMVIGVETSPDGNHKLYLSDGRQVGFNNVELITYPPQSQPPASDGTGDDETPADGDDTTGGDDDGTGDDDTTGGDDTAGGETPPAGDGTDEMAAAA